MGKPLLKYFFLASCCALFVACSEEEGEAQHIQYEDIKLVMDTIEAKRTFTPLPARDIIASVTGNIKGSVKLILPRFEESDSTKINEYLNAIAVNSTYAIWAQYLNQQKVKDSALAKVEYLLEKIDGNNKNKSSKGSIKIDSLDAILSNYFADDSLAHQYAYFEAVTWLENFSISLTFDKTIKSQSVYRELIVSQLTKGEELLDYLYDFQDYEPISQFSMQMLDVLDCKNYELNITQLKELVMDLRAVYVAPNQ